MSHLPQRASTRSNSESRSARNTRSSHPLSAPIKAVREQRSDAVAEHAVITSYGTEEANPCLSNIRQLQSLEDAMTVMTRLPGFEDCPPESEGGDLLIPTPEHGRLCFDVVRAVFDGYLHRNLSCPEFRSIATASVILVNHPADRHGHSFPTPVLAVPGARPRGFFAVIPAGAGRRVTANSIAAYLKTEPIAIEVATQDGQLGRYLQLPAMRIAWPARGSLRSFAKAFIANVDAAVGTTYLTRNRGALHRGEQEVIAALCAFAVALNLGVLIVERINTRDARGRDAETLWDVLGQFTSATGIPVLCFGTPGAAAALSEQSSAIGELVTHSVYSLPADIPTSEVWCLFAKVIFAKYLKDVVGSNEPDWFTERLWQESLGHYRLAKKACIHVSSKLRAAESSQLSPGDFVRYAKDALTLEQPHLRAIGLWRRGGGRFTATSIRRHGDWLPLDALMTTVPGLVEEYGHPALIASDSGAEAQRA
ncbi:hypothetical protein KTE45_03945 [Burkholderia multivorans]|uniref:hypothetical protein n=1 Tax=Burkholderia multivorans TaxID=87883 RepID=UPI001C26BC83|nr:hypothetical protein [Burkholderia multivorans]MBU9517614.1 hypothetical protein [Burkholderia multivorans]